MDLIWIFLPAILLLGIITSYQDIKFGKIRNKYIAAALIYALVAYVILVFLKYPFANNHFRNLVINFLVAFIIGFLIWIVALWSAADAKLFLAYAALLPLAFYSNSYFNIFPSFVLLINTFVPFFIFAFFKLSFFTKTKEKREALKNFKPIHILLIVLNIFWISWTPRLISLVTGMEFDFLINLSIILFLFMILQGIFQKKSMWFLWLSIILAGIRFLFDFENILRILFLKQFALILLIIISIFFIIQIGSHIFAKEIKISELKQGMILAYDIYLEKGKKKYEQGFVPKAKFGKLTLEGKAEGLTPKDIKRIKELNKKRKLNFKEIKIQQTLPFAPFMFLGTVLTLIVKGNFLLLVNYLR